MALIKCKCKKREMNFTYLREKDLPGGWECEECPKAGAEAPAQEAPAEEPAQEAPKAEEKAEAAPKKPRKGRQKAEE